MGCGAGPAPGWRGAGGASTPFAHDVRFTGLKTSHELLPLYAQAGCFVLPSTREPWGLVVNEAMAADLPVLVSSRCGCCADLVQEGVNGFSFDPSAPEEIEHWLHTMERMPAEQRAAMGRCSGEIVSRFSPEGFGDAIATIAAARGSAAKPELLPEVSS